MIFEKLFIFFFFFQDIMGPDEDHETVSNNGYTNVVVGYALYFAE